MYFITNFVDYSEFHKLSLGGTLYVCLLLFYRKFVALLPLLFWVYSYVSLS